MLIWRRGCSLLLRLIQVPFSSSCLHQRQGSWCSHEAPPSLLYKKKSCTQKNTAKLQMQKARLTFAGQGLDNNRCAPRTLGTSESSSQGCPGQRQKLIYPHSGRCVLCMNYNHVNISGQNQTVIGEESCGGRFLEPFVQNHNLNQLSRQITGD